MADPTLRAPTGLALTLDSAPSLDVRAELGRRINAFHDQTVPFHAERFAVLLHAEGGALAGGLTGGLMWGWLFVDAVWVDPAWRRHALGRTLMQTAEEHARMAGCHSAWLDTFQAGAFYKALGYEEFGRLDDYPAGQSRLFLRKKLI